MIFRRYFAILLSVMGLISVSSCDVHQFPDPKIQFVLNLEYDTEMPLYTVIEYGEKSTKSLAEEYDVRYKVEVFDGKDPNSREVLYSFVFIKDEISELDNSLTMPLPRGEYRFAVWTDYVPQGSDADLYYNTDRFEYVCLSEGNHVGSNDMRDAFAGVITATVSKECTQADLLMRRPMGKFNFIATDARDYDLTGYSVAFYYNGFVPSAYNMHTAKLADSATGISFVSDIARQNDDEAELGFDYVLVNGKETVVSVYIEIYDPAGKMLSRTAPIDVPLVQSKLTTVKAQFLTMKAGGVVSLVPDYDGEYNLVIN